MKKLLLVIGILIAANVLLAQEEKPAQENEEIFREKIINRLELKAEQEVKLKELRQKYSQELKSIRADQEKSTSEKLYAAASVIERKEKELASVLSEKQLSEMKTIRREAREKRTKRRTRMLKRRLGNH